MTNMLVEYIDHMGTDLSIVNSAKASFAKVDTEFKPKEHTRLINYLARGLSQADYDELVKSVADCTNVEWVQEQMEQYRHTPSHFCYDSQTEIITPNGWKFFKDLTDKDLVGQVTYTKDVMTLQWVKPSHIVKEPYKGTLLGCLGSTVDYLVTPNHRMLFKPRTSYGWRDWTIAEAEAIQGKDFKVATTARLSQTGDGSYNDGALYGFLLADGFKSYKQIHVRLKKLRKVKYLTNLLNELGITYNITIHESVYTFKFYHALWDKLDKVTSKKLDINYQTCSTEYLQGIYDGYMQGDGSKKHKQYCFASSSPTLFDDICFLSSVLGYQPFKGKTRHFDNPNHNTNYRGIISSRHRANTRSTKFYQQKYDGNVYCVTVPSGMVLVRRNGTQLVSGNSPFCHATVSLRLKAPIAIHAQFMKHTVGFSHNSTSRRYISDTPDYYLPTFRSKPTGNIKQGSGDVFTVKHAVYDEQDNLIAVFDTKEDADAYSVTVNGDFNIGEIPYDSIARVYKTLLKQCLQTYDEFIAIGIAPEQARFVLPQGVMTEWVTTGSLYAWARLYNLRSDSHAQKEIQELAHMIGDIIQPLFPVSWNALTLNHKE